MQIYTQIIIYRQQPQLTWHQFYFYAKEKFQSSQQKSVVVHGNIYIIYDDINNKQI